MAKQLSYMGKTAKIDMDKSGDKASITIDKKKFDIHVHAVGKPEENYIRLWMCHDAYTMTETPEKMAKHIIRYWHQFA